MNIDKIEIGKNPPEQVNVIIEVPMGTHPINMSLIKIQGHYLLTVLSILICIILAIMVSFRIRFQVMVTQQMC